MLGLGNNLTTFRNFGGSIPYLLDTYTGATAAYSLRQLSSATTNVVRVRRSSDNTEQNFTANQITDGTLTSFCGAGNGFVTTWYDQSGNNRNAIQTTLLNQPQIVINGNVFLENGKPAIKPVAGQNLVANISAGSQYSVFQLDKRGSITANYYIPNRGGLNNNYYWYNVYNSTLTALGSNSGNPNYYVNGNLFTGTTQGQAWNFDTGNQRILTALNLNLSTWTKYEFQYGIGDNNFVSFQERILFNSNQSLNRTGIETNINEFYSIY